MYSGALSLPIGNNQAGSVWTRRIRVTWILIKDDEGLSPFPRSGNDTNKAKSGKHWWRNSAVTKNVRPRKYCEIVLK